MSHAVAARELLESLVGKQIETATGQPDIALRIDGDNVKRRKDPPERAVPGDRWSYSDSAKSSACHASKVNHCRSQGRERTPTLSGIH